MDEFASGNITSAPNDGTAFAQECQLIDATCNLPGKFSEALVGNEVSSQQYGQSQSSVRTR